MKSIVMGIIMMRSTVIRRMIISNSASFEKGSEWIRFRNKFALHTVQVQLEGHQSTILFAYKLQSAIPSQSKSVQVCFDRLTNAFLSSQYSLATQIQKGIPIKPAENKDKLQELQMTLLSSTPPKRRQSQTCDKTGATNSRYKLPCPSMCT